MKKIFLDCGFYAGGAMKHYQEQDIIDKSWTIYAFEPYPREDIKNLLEARLPLKVNLIQKAAWINDDGIDFVLKGREDAHHLWFDGADQGETITHVDTIDFPEFVANLPEAYIICNMDIEGSEFRVLEQMLKDGSIMRLDELDVEFHHRLLNEYDEEDSQKLIDRILARGVKLRLRVPLN